MDYSKEEDFPRSRPKAKSVPPPPGSKRRAVTDESSRGDDDSQPIGPSPDAVTLPPDVRYLRLKDLKVGTLLLGVVSEITSTDLVVSLPYFLTGYVAHQHTMEAEYIDTDEGSVGVAPLGERFRVGQIVACVVLKTEKERRIDLSLRPSLCNAGLTIDTIQPNMWLPASLHSVQEHGYLLSLGLPHIHAFLPEASIPLKETAEGSGNEDEGENDREDDGHRDPSLRPYHLTKEQLTIGSLLFVSIETVNKDAKTVVCTAIPSAKPLGKSDLDLKLVKAGLLVECRVKTLLDSPSLAAAATREGRKKGGEAEKGLLVSLLGSLLGAIHPHHVKHPCLAADAPSIALKKKLVGRIIAVIPSERVVRLSLLPHLQQWQSYHMPSHMPPGTQLDTCTVLDITSRDFMRVTAPLPPAEADGDEGAAAGGQKMLGLCHLSRMSDKPIEKVEDAYRIGQTCKARVLSSNAFEGGYLISTRLSLLEEKYLAFHQLHVGEVVTGVIEKILDGGVLIKLSDHVKGIVPHEHLTDVPLRKVPSRFKPGIKAKFRVLRLDTADRRLQLTAKKTLVRDDNALTDISQAHVNQIVTGSVGTVQSFGIVVHFYADIRGLLPARALSDTFASDHKKGQLVTARITRVDQDGHQLMLSLDLQPKVKERPLPVPLDVVERGQQEADEDEKDLPVVTDGNKVEKLLEYGQIVDSVRLLPVVKTEPTDTQPTPQAPQGLYASFVAVDTSADDGTSSRVMVVGYIPPGHLSDDVEQNNRIHQIAQETSGGHTLRFPSAVVLSPGAPTPDKKTRAPVVSLKPSLIEVSRSGQFVTQLEDISLHEMRLAYVRRFSPAGVVVGLGSWRCAGLVLKPFLSDRFVENAEDIYSEGQTVWAKVIDVQEPGGETAKGDGKAPAQSRRINLDLRQSALGGRDAKMAEMGSKILASYLDGERLLLTQSGALDSADESSSAWQHVKIGGLLSATVSSVKPYGLILSINDSQDLTGIVHKAHYPTKRTDRLTEGAEVTAFVLDVNIDKKIVDVSLKDELVDRPLWTVETAASAPKGKKKRKRSGGDPADDVRAALVALKGTTISAEAQLSRSLYSVLTCDTSVGERRVKAVIIAPGPCLNDVKRHAQKDGDKPRVKVAIRDTTTLPVAGECLVGVAQWPSSKRKEAKGKKKVAGRVYKEEELQVGSLIKGDLKAVKPTHAFGRTGRNVQISLHGTQMLDPPPLPSKPHDESSLPDAVMPLEGLKGSGQLEGRIVRVKHRQQGGAVDEEGNDEGVFVVEITTRPEVADAMDPADKIREMGDALVPTWKNIKVGEHYSGVLMSIDKDGLWVELSPHVKGRVFITDASPHLSVLKNIKAHFHVGQLLTVEVLHATGASHSAKKSLDLAIAQTRRRSGVIPVGGNESLDTKEGQREYARRRAPAGKRVVGRVAAVNATKGGGELAVSLGGCLGVRMHCTEIHDHLTEKPLKGFKEGQLVPMVILGLADEKSKLVLEGSLRPSLLAKAETASKKDKITTDRPLDPSAMSVGQVVGGYISQSNARGVFVALSHALTGRIRLGELRETPTDPSEVESLFPVGKLLRRLVVKKVEDDRVELSLKDAATLKEGQQILTFDDVKEGDTVTGRVKRKESFGVFIRIDNSVSLDCFCHVSEISDAPPPPNNLTLPLQSLKVGDRVKAKVIKVNTDQRRLSVSLKPSNFADEGDQEDINEDADMLDGLGMDEDDMAEEEEPADAEVEMNGDEAIDEIDDQEEVLPPAKRRKTERNAAKRARDAQEEHEEDSGKQDRDDVSSSAPFPPPKRRKRKAASEPSEEDLLAASSDTGALLGEVFDFGDVRLYEGGQPEPSTMAAGEESSGESGDEELGDHEEAVPVKRKSKRAKEAKKRLEEASLRAAEESALREDWASNPQSPDDFERLLLTKGDSSIVWIKYMAYWLKLSELRHAREVAERGVKHISFREDKERQNVWIAYLNMECSFGTQQQLDQVFKRACQFNSPKAIWLQMGYIYQRNNKMDLCEATCQKTCDKFPQAKKVWIRYLTYLYEVAGKAEEARQVLPKALRQLPKRKHIAVITKAALLEYKHASADRGQTIFEGLLRTYPRRLDLWAQHLDAHIKASTPPRQTPALLDNVRQVFERAVALSLKPQKMKFFFKRWLDFEKRHGTAAGEQEVQNKAREYVQRIEDGQQEKEGS